jgi:hypothetical protein
MEKAELMSLIFSDADFALMRRVHDAFNPSASLNPAKIFPLGKGCGEIRVRPTRGHATIATSAAPSASSLSGSAGNSASAKPEAATAKH